MKKLIKDSKKGGFRGHCARRNLKLAIGAGAFLFLLAAVLICTGTTGGVISGVAMAVAPLAGFVLPEGVEFSDNEKKGLQALAEHLTKQMNDLHKGAMTEDAFKAKLTEELGKMNLSEEKIKQIEKSLEEQGMFMAKHKNGFPFSGGHGLMKAFHDNFDNLKTAIKERRVDFRVQSKEEPTADNIHMTSNTVTVSGGASAVELNGVDPNIHLKRRDRQYIHDIASTSYVQEVPETFTFDEEGDEEGAIALVDENGLKPLVKLGLIKNRVTAKKAAGRIVVTEEMMKWRPRAWAAIQRLFRDKVYRDFENQLTEDMLANAVAYAGTPLDATLATPSDLDAVIAAVLQGESLNYQFDTLVLNPADKWKIAMTTTANGTLILPYISQGGQFSLLGLRVITTNKVTAGTFVVGESGTWFIEEESPTIRTGYGEGDFEHNRFSIIGEIYYLSYVPSNNAGSFVNGNFADIKEALKSDLEAAAGV